MTRAERKDKGGTHSRSNYNTKTIEPRGTQPDESRMQKSFWKDHSMDEVITWSAKELEDKLEAYFSAYETRQIKIKPQWWWPEDPLQQVSKIRAKKKESKYKADPFNRSL